MLSDFALGVILNLIGSVFINLGTNVVKLAHTENQTTPDPIRGCSNTWTAGVTTFICGNLLNFMSFSFAPQSLLAALGSVQFPTNVVFGVFLLGEEITTPTLTATALIVVGNIVIVFHSQTAQTFRNPEELMGRYWDPTYRNFLCFQALLVVGLQCLYRQAKSKKPHHEGYRSRLVIPVCYAAVSAIVGSQSVLLAKSTSVLLKATMVGSVDPLTHPFFYAVLIGWMLTMSFWLYRMNTALRRFDTLFIFPLLQVIWTLFSIIGGGLYFNEFTTFDNYEITMFVFGVALVIFGVCVLITATAGRTVPHAAGGDDNNDDELKILTPEASPPSTNLIRASSQVSLISEDNWVPWQLPASNTSTPSFSLAMPLFDCEANPLLPPPYVSVAKDPIRTCSFD